SSNGGTNTTLRPKEAEKVTTNTGTTSRSSFGNSLRRSGTSTTRRSIGVRHRSTTQITSRSSFTTIGGGSDSPKAKRNTTIWRNGLPHFRSSTCRPLRWRATPTARRMRIRALTPRNLPASIRTVRSRAASGTTCPRRRRRRSRKRSSTSMDIDRRTLFKAAGACIAGVTMSPMQRAIAAATHLPDEGGFPSLNGATEWINSQPLTPPDLRGNVVLVDFWTYTCVNWLRTLPYVRTWAAKYKDHGLVVVGVHSPEFSFEKDADNVRRAVASLKVDYPVAIDSDHAIWRAFDNQYWPALYFIDAQGRIRDRHFGEGEYERSEKVIQQLLAENGARGVGADMVAVKPIGVEVSADWA